MIELITSLTAIFLAAAAVLFIFNKLNHPTIPAYLVAGILISSIVDKATVMSLAEVGVAFLVFIFGVSLKLKKTEKVIESTLIITLGQIAAVSIIVYSMAFAIGFTITEAVYLAIVSSISSSLIGLEIMEGGKVKQAYKRICISINLIQDLVVILLFLILASIPLAIRTTIPNLFVGVILLSIGIVMRPLLSNLIENLKRSGEIAMLIAVSTLLIFTGIAGYAGISIVVGAFAAGLALSKPPYDEEVINTVEPLKYFFSAIFFVSLGALIVIPTISTLLIALGLIFTITILRPFITLLLIQIKGYSKGTSYMAAFNMDQMSEFALILAIAGFTALHIRETVFQAIILAAIITMITSAYTSRYLWEIYDKLEKYWFIGLTDKKYVDAKVPEDIEKHFIIGGYNEQGKELAHFLIGNDQKVVIIDNDPERILEAKQNRVNYIYGDMMLQGTWEKAKHEKAKMIIQIASVKNLLNKTLELETKADKVLRVRTVKEAKGYLKKCTYVMIPHYLAVERLIEHIAGCIESESYRVRLREINKREMSWLK